MNWSPFEIRLVLHAHCIHDDFPQNHTQLYTDTVARFMGNGILEIKEGRLSTTAKGTALVEMWCNTPVPVMAWLDPRFSEVPA